MEILEKINERLDEKNTLGEFVFDPSKEIQKKLVLLKNYIEKYYGLEMQEPKYGELKALAGKAYGLSFEMNYETHVSPSSDPIFVIIMWQGNKRIGYCFGPNSVDARMKQAGYAKKK